MPKRSLGHLLHKKRGKKELSSEMRTLLESFEAQYATPHPKAGGEVSAVRKAAKN